LFNSEIETVHWVTNYASLEEIENFTGYQTMGILKFSSGAVGTMHYSATVAQGQGTSKLEVFGSNTKTLTANWNNHLMLKGEDSKKQEWNFTEKGTKVWGHYQADSYFIECILREKIPGITVDDAIKAQNVASKMMPSI